MELKVSRQLVLSEQRYRGADGQLFRYVLAGRSGQLLRLGLDAAAALEVGAVPVQAALRAPLIEAEVLVAADDDETGSVAARNQRAAADPGAVSFTILPSAHCNMGCGYCGQQHRRGGMAPDIYRAVVRRVCGAIGAPATASVHVQWFGAEPMVAYGAIVRMSRHFLRAARRSGTSYVASMVSNGSLLTLEKLLKLHLAAGLQEVCITLDGPQAIHDARRPLKQGTANHAHIVALLEAVRQCPQLAGLTIVLRTNIDRFNSAWVADYLREMAERGFNTGQFVFDLHAVYPWSNDVSAVELSKQAYAASETHWMILMLRLGLRFTIVPTAPHRVVCVAVKAHAEVIDMEGRMYSCTEHPLVPLSERADSLGNVATHGPDQPRAAGAFDGFNAALAAGGLPCARCPLLGICGGSCPKHWQEGLSPCPSFKYNMQARLDIAAVAGGASIV